MCHLSQGMTVLFCNFLHSKHFCNENSPAHVFDIFFSSQKNAQCYELLPCESQLCRPDDVSPQRSFQLYLHERQVRIKMQTHIILPSPRSFFTLGTVIKGYQMQQTKYQSREAFTALQVYYTKKILCLYQRRKMLDRIWVMCNQKHLFPFNDNGDKVQSVPCVC